MYFLTVNAGWIVIVHSADLLCAKTAVLNIANKRERRSKDTKIKEQF